jgi:hypothetical protein
LDVTGENPVAREPNKAISHISQSVQPQ